MIEVSQEARFDQDDYIKTATAFNPSNSNTSRSFSQQPLYQFDEGKSFTERLIEGNSISKITQKNRLELPNKALTSEEINLKKCTFKPDIYRGRRYYKVLQFWYNILGQTQIAGPL